MTPFGKSGNLDQQFFITKRDFEVIISSRSQTFNAVLDRSTEAANQEYRDIDCPGLLFDTTTKLNAVDDRHHNVANHNIGRK